MKIVLTIDFNGVQMIVNDPETQLKIVSLAMGQKVSSAKHHVSKKHSKGYRATKWGKDEDEKLLDMFTSGKTIRHIGKILGRSDGAVSVRLHKLGKKTPEIQDK